MANFSYEDYESKKSIGGSEFKVGFFGLKDDGDEAVVRFDISSVQDLEIVTVHNVEATTKDGKKIYKRVSCLRGVNDSIDKCPLCASGNKLALKLYVKLIEYVKNEDGKISPKARIWERPANFASNLKSFIDEYGDLSNLIFKIKRRGAKGSMQTTYDIILTRPEIYKPEVYVKDFSDFDGYKVAGSSYLVKTAEEMKSYLTTGDFPKVESAAKPVTSPAQTTAVQSGYIGTAQMPTQPSVATSTVPTNSNPTNPLDGRPKRYNF